MVVRVVKIEEKNSSNMCHLILVQLFRPSEFSEKGGNTEGNCPKGVFQKINWALKKPSPHFCEK